MPKKLPSDCDFNCESCTNNECNAPESLAEYYDRTHDSKSNPSEAAQW